MHIVAGLGASTLLGVTGSVMLAPLGPLAALGITNAVAIILFTAIYGLLSAMSVRVGEVHGAKQRCRIPALLPNGLVLGGVTGTLGMLTMLGVWPLLVRLGQPPEVLAIMFPYWVSIAALIVSLCLGKFCYRTLQQDGRLSANSLEKRSLSKNSLIVL